MTAQQLLLSDRWVCGQVLAVAEDQPHTFVMKCEQSAGHSGPHRSSNWLEVAAPDAVVQVKVGDFL